MAQLILLCWQHAWLSGESFNDVGVALFVVDIVALIWLVTHRRCRACFVASNQR